MASELIEKIDRWIADPPRGREGEVDHECGWKNDLKINGPEAIKIIEALQAMDDLETVVNSKRQLDVLLSSTGGVLAIVQKHAAHHRFVSVYGDTIPAALRAAAEAIKKGGTE